jgi:hypothetical protein
MDRLRSWWWRLRYACTRTDDDWWVDLPWVREAYCDGYRMAWHESRIPGMTLDEASAFNDWASRVGDKY